MHEVLEEEVDTSLSAKYLGIKTSTLAIIAIFIIGIGIYLGILLFGTNSLDAYIQLQTYEEGLKKDIKTLKQENAQMQKEYFQLKEITSGE